MFILLKSRNTSFVDCIFVLMFVVYFEENYLRELPFLLQISLEIALLGLGLDLRESGFT